MRHELQSLKYRIRLIQLLTAAEQADLVPISLDKLHAFAFLADVLSPVWNLRPFEDRIGRTGKSPYYPDLQKELDLLVAMGLVEPSELNYVVDEVEKEVRFNALYALRFSSAHLTKLAGALRKDETAVREQAFLNALAEALASLPDEEIAQAASKDLVYERSGLDNEDYIDLDQMSGTSRTVRAVASFDQAFPGSKLTPARRLYMYANYLGRRAHG